MTAEVWFYHLEREPLATVLLRILAGLQARGDRACVHLGSPETLQGLSQGLWSQDETAFTVHGCDGDPMPERQSLWLTSGAEAPNAAPFRFYCEGLLPEALTGHARASILFEGTDETVLTNIRNCWKKFKSAGHTVKYWRQNESNRWEDQAANK